MGFHYEEQHIIDGSIDNRTKGKTIVKINFCNHTSSLITLQGNPCRDLAGSVWKFSYPHGRLDDEPGGQCFFIPALCEGTVGRISYAAKREVPVLPIEEHYDRLFDDNLEDPPTKVAPVLELEWFSQKFGQIEIDCQQMTMELVEMAWSMSAEEAEEETREVDQTREEIHTKAGESMSAFYEEMELIEEYVEEEIEPHELEEKCFLIVQEFVINSADDSEQKQDLHGHLLKLQEQMAGAFEHYTNEGTFEDVPQTIRLLSGVLPFIDRAAGSAKFTTETTAELLGQLRGGVVALRDELAQARDR
jgi:hypothetical protein